MTAAYGEITAVARNGMDGVKMNFRKIDLMHQLFGKAEPFKCRDCSNLVCGRYHDKTLRKCKVYGLTHSEASDWALKYTACGMFNKEYSGHPIIQLVKHNSNRIKPPEEPLEGQMKMGGDSNE